jgi:uncharacterized protein
VHTFTVIAIVAAAAAGIIAAVLLIHPTPNVGGFDGSNSESDNQQQKKKMNASGAMPTKSTGYQQVNITVNGVELVADLAVTDEQKSNGLGIKDSLKENEAMLFPFSREDKHTFWMNGMKFPIDIIWLDNNKQVVHVEHSLDPCGPNSFCPTYTPREDSLYVLETVAGFAQKYNITEGTSVEFELDS